MTYESAPTLLGISYVGLFKCGTSPASPKFKQASRPVRTRQFPISCDALILLSGPLSSEGISVQLVFDPFITKKSNYRPPHGSHLTICLLHNYCTQRWKGTETSEATSSRPVVHRQSRVNHSLKQQLKAAQGRTRLYYKCCVYHSSTLLPDLYISTDATLSHLVNNF